MNMDVPALGPAITFYTSALGLKLNRVLDGDGAELGGADCGLYLLLQAEGEPPVPGRDLERRYARHWTPVHVDFVVDDLEAAVDRAVRAGARRESPPCRWRGSTHVSFSDPFGHGFCLISFAKDGYEGDEPPDPDA